MNSCFYCGVQVYRELERRNKHNHPLMTQDHVIPRARTKGLSGSMNTTTVTACMECNLDKGMLTIEEYRVLLAFRYGYISGVDFKFAGE